jgi:hypothetical protein
MTRPKFDDREGGYLNLICPDCGSTYLHHGTVEVFFRKEDSPTVVHTEAFGQGANVEAKLNGLSGNPSPRRGGVKITFSCEECSMINALQIIQHKGETELSWGVA